MLSNVINAGKDIANRLTNKFLNLSEIEVKIKTGTNDDNWGPNGSLMKEIADETFSTTNFQEVMTYLWYRIFTEKPLNNRRTYKGLVLLQYLIVNGSELVAASCRAHLVEIRKLQSYIDCHRVADVSIRKKAGDIIELLSDSQRLAGERKRAKSYQTRNYRAQTVAGADAYECRQKHAQSLGDIDDWQVGSPSLPYAIGESFMNFVTTFTHNISGPPPTETHDNFDISAMEYESSTPPPPPLPQPKDMGKNEYVCNSSSPASQSRNPNQVSKIDSSNTMESNSNDPIKAIPAAMAVPLERPIIDFSDPEVISGPVQNADEDFFLAMNNNKIDNSDIDEEFGNLRAWDHPGDVMIDPITNNNYHHHNTPAVDFGRFFPPNSIGKPNVDSSSQLPSVTSSIQLSNQQAQAHIGNSSSTMGKPNKKIGSTWNEIDALNIDLNNLCDRKRMYSKS